MRNEIKILDRIIFRCIRGELPEVKMSIIPKSAGKCIHVDQNTTIVLLNYPNPAYLYGILNVKAIRGTVRIFGYDLSPNAPPVPAYSSREFNTLIVVPKNDTHAEDDTLYLKSLPIPADTVHRLSQKSNYSHVLVVSKSEQCDSFVSFRNQGFPIFTKPNADEPMVRLSSTVEENLVAESSQWDELAEKLLTKCRKIAICGGKDVGKSTLLRFLVNRHLAKWRKVLVLDFDPGQSEFTVMGCLSAVLVEQPLLGPNFSHLSTPERCIYLGDISVNSYRTYCEYVEKLISFCDHIKYKDIPWIINTMGFVKGLGISLLADIVERIKPTDIVEIMSEKESNNFPDRLTPSFFNSEKLKRNEDGCWKSLHILKSMTEESNNFPNRSTASFNSKKLKYDEGGRCKHRLHILKSMAESVSSSVHFRKADIKRDIVTMAYLKRAAENSGTDLLGVIPKKIKTDGVRIVIVKPMSKEIEMTMTLAQKLCCINANLVALCTGYNSRQHDCLGFGVIRGFDTETNYLYVLTPLSEDTLKRVTVIQMSSSIQVPRALYKNHIDQMSGSYPYFSYKIPEKLNQPLRKTSSRLRLGHDTKNDSSVQENTE